MSLMGTLGKVAMGIAVAKGLGKVMGGSAGGSGGGIGDLLGGLMGGQKGGASSNGGLGGILDSLGGSQLGNAQEPQGRNQGGFGDLFNTSLQGQEVDATSEQEKQAEIMLRAMINAAKADGDISADEQAKIKEHLGDISEEEANFVRQEISAPLDTNGFIQSIPRGMEQQVYLMSLLAINLDSNEEAHYLDQLAKGLNISHDVCNQIHEKVGAPAIYS